VVRDDWLRCIYGSVHLRSDMGGAGTGKYVMDMLQVAKEFGLDVEDTDTTKTIREREREYIKHLFAKYDEVVAKMKKREELNYELD
jgi:hypothetical protein